MAGPIVIPNCAQITLQWSNHGISFLNVLHGANTTAGPINPTAAEAFFSALKAANGVTAWMGALPPDTSLVGVSIRDIRFTQQTLSESTGSPIVGADSTGTLPPQVAICVTLTTNNVGKQNRGRIYLGGLGRTVSGTDGLINSSGMAAAPAFVQALRDVMSAQLFPMVIGQVALPERPNKAGELLPARQAGTVPVTGHHVRDNIFDTQRRRLT